MLGVVEMRIREFLAEPVERRAAGRRHRRGMQRDELGGEEVGNPPDQRLLGREVVVQCRDIDADTVRDAAGPQPLEAVGRKARERGPHQAIAAFVAAGTFLLLLRRHVAPAPAFMNQSIS
jgi:hypothetical protein